LEISLKTDRIPKLLYQYKPKGRRQIYATVLILVRRSCYCRWWTYCERTQFKNPSEEQRGCSRDLFQQDVRLSRASKPVNMILSEHQNRSAYVIRCFMRQIYVSFTLAAMNTTEQNCIAVTRLIPNQKVPASNPAWGLVFLTRDLRFSQRWRFISWSSELQNRVEGYQRFGGPCFLHLQGEALTECWYRTTSLHVVITQKTTTWFSISFPRPLRWQT
jgi:hypothetical protein